MGSQIETMLEKDLGKVVMITIRDTEDDIIVRKGSMMYAGRAEHPSLGRNCHLFLESKYENAHGQIEFTGTYALLNELGFDALSNLPAYEINHASCRFLGKITDSQLKLWENRT